MICYVIFGDFVGWDWGTPAILQQKHTWKNLIKIWDWATPPPQLGQKTKFFDRSHLRAPLTMTTQTTLSSSHHWGLISSVSFSNPCHSDTLCWKRLGKEGIIFKSPERRALPALQGHQETWSWFRQFHPSCQHPLSVIGEILFPNQTAKGFKDFAKE